VTTETRTPEAPETWMDNDEPRLLRGLRLHHLMYAILYVALFCWVAVITTFLFMAGLLFLTGGAAIGLAVVIARRRTTYQDALLRILSIAADRGMPLAPALEAYASQCHGEYRRKVLALVHYLRLGMPLPQALEREPGLMPSNAEVLVNVGWESGVLSGALREAAATRSALQPAWIALSSRFAYLVVLLGAIQVIVGFIMYFIVPKFEAIFNDFGARLPEITILLIHGTHWLIRYGWLFGLLIVGSEVFLLMYLPISFYGWINWYVPGIDRLFLARHTGLILRSLARVVEGEEPIQWGVATLVKCYPTGWVRRRLRKVALDMTEGKDWCLSLYEQGLIRGADAAVLDAARKAGNLPWALRETAESAERRLAYRLQAWVQALFPFFLILIGALVFVIAVGYFSPLVLLIERLAR
jgi:protein transport protein HofC